MSKLLLTSNGFYTTEIKNAFISLIENEIRASAAIITTASAQKHNNLYAIKAREDLLDMGFSKVEFIDVEFEEPELLKQYQVIYINGGNPFYLLHHLRHSCADQVIKDIADQSNYVIVGASAGAVVLGPDIEVVNYFTPDMNSVNLLDLRALGITNVSIFPHYDREDVFPEKTGRTIEERLLIFENIRKRSITRLKDDGFIIVN